MKNTSALFIIDDVIANRLMELEDEHISHCLLYTSKKAESFIFMEYFIIAPGVMWDTILDILIDKVKQGVEVRVMYDDAGCITTLPQD